jgi:2-hydroxycyclohexanecarboxyl-CoA dehydrogenase
VTEPRTAIITGAASGMGLTTAERFATDGRHVAIFDLNGHGAEAAAAGIEASGGRARGYRVDVTDRATIDAAVAEVVETLGPPTILVNSAGLTGFQPFLEITPDEWKARIDVNLTGTFNCCQAVVPHMLQAGWGRIVNISSSSTHKGVAGMTHYVASKAAVNGFSKSLALELAPKGITVNIIPPGFIDTPMTRAAAAAGSISIDHSISTTPVGRQGRPQDIAAACAFLVSDEAGYITGQILGVNGGRNT